jgi:MscS family membrane protein
MAAGDIRHSDREGADSGIRTIFWEQWFEIKEKLALKVKEIVEGAGTGFAFPSRSIYMGSPAGEKPDVFVPPGDQSR